MLKIGDRVKVLDHYYSKHYIGLVGKIIWMSQNGGQTIQIETETRPKWFRVKPGPWVLTCVQAQVELVKN